MEDNIINVLYLCADNDTILNKHGNIMEYISQIFTENSNINQYSLGLQIHEGLLNSNICKLDLLNENIDKCNFNLKFDIIISEYCPLFNNDIFIDKIIELCKMKLTSVGVFIVPFIGDIRSYPDKIKDMNYISQFFINNSVYTFKKNTVKLVSEMLIIFKNIRY
jgi:hypothetical protein